MDQKFLELPGGILQKCQQILFGRSREARSSIPKSMGVKDLKICPTREKTALIILQRNKKNDNIINDTDEHVGPACTDKDVMQESKRQLYEKRVYNQLTQEEANQLIRVIKATFYYCE